MTAHIVRTATRLIAVAFLLASCGESGLLDGLGTRSQEAVYGDSTTTTIAVLVDPVTEREVGAVAASTVTWFNDIIERQFQGEPSYVIQKVWQRRSEGTRFIQASRLEVSQALPNVRFPSLVPDEVRWITSQLVFDTTSATLDRDVSAAFGLWGVEPYTVTDGSLAVLRVGLAPEEERNVAFQILADVVEEGISLSWVTGDYRYELFCRQSLPEDLCWQMAETNKLLAGQLRGAEPVEVAAAGA